MSHIKIDPDEGTDRKERASQSQEKRGPTMFAGRFDGRCAVITGGASGLGLVCAKRIVQEGGRVALWDINPQALAENKKVLHDAYTMEVDVSNLEQIKAAAKQSRRVLGKIDILVNSAGITGATVPVVEFPVDSRLRVLEVNLSGVFYCCRQIAPIMTDQRYGRIINVASVAGKEGNPNASAYSASKAGVIGFTKSLGKELATTGVLVNCITPATFQSPILRQMPQSQIDYMRSRIPIGRLGEASESAALVCWLASEECSFSTAATFDVSGGRTTY